MMKVIAIKFIIISLVNVLTAWQAGFAQQRTINIQTDTSGSQLEYAGNEIKKAATGEKYAVQLFSSLAGGTNADINVKIISDSALSEKIATDENIKKPANLGWQCYAIRVKTNGNKKNGLHPGRR
jgi:hypothetical protein